MKRNEEAIAEIRRALDLDPLSVIINRIYGDILVDGRRYDEAIAQYQKTLDLDPNFLPRIISLGVHTSSKACTTKQLRNTQSHKP